MKEPIPIKITFPEGETGDAEICFEDGEMMVTIPIPWPDQEFNFSSQWWEQLTRCCHVFVDGELAHAVTGFDLENGIKVERIEAKI